MTTLNASVGIAEEVTYGTPVVVTRFFPFIEDGLEPSYGMTNADDEMRAGSLGPRIDQMTPYVEGADGPFTLYVPTKGFGVFLKHALGSASTGIITDSNYTATFTPSATGLNGKSLTYQANRPFHPSGGNQAITFHGCKIDALELLCEIESYLKATITFDAEDADTATALAAPSYLSIANNAAKFPWSLATVTINGTQVETTRFRVNLTNNLKVDRRFLRGSALKKEPVRNGRMGVEWDLEVDWADLTQYNRVSASTITNRFTTIVATFSGVAALAGATVPQLVVTIHAAVFDEGLPTVSGPEPLMQSPSGIAGEDGTNPLVTITYRTTDATP